MATEFTRLSDVPMIEEVQKEDTVLVVHDGEVKRAPKTAVGGGAGCDALFVLFVHDGVVDYAEMLVGDYDTLITKYFNHEPIIAYTCLIDGDNQYPQLVDRIDVSSWYDTDEAIYFPAPWGYYIVLLPDNSIDVWSVD